MKIDILNQLLAERNIQIHSISAHTKASESYIEVTIIQENGFSWNGLIPYYYRRTGLFLETEQVGQKTERLLVPIPRGAQTGYETFSQKFKIKAIEGLKSLNIYELSSANKAGLLPDHKFPEIRWDTETRAENPDDMSETEIKNKFQLLDNQRNQQKREVCRQCFQTGKRGIIFGVSFFYEGNENWASDIPKVGKIAEQGCVGCAWYDIEKWRSELNKRIVK